MPIPLDPAAATPSLGAMTAPQAHAALTQDPAWVVVDVREAHEYAAGHLDGARLEPLGQLASWSATLDPAAPTLLVCRSGMRSASARRQLQQLGFTRVVNLTGGMTAWLQEGYPVASGPATP